MSDSININTRQGPHDTLDGLVSNTLTELEENEVSTIASYALYSNTGIESVEFQNVTGVGSYGMCGCTNLQSVSLPACKTIGANAFEGDGKLSEVSIPECTKIEGSAFKNACVPKLVLPKVTSIAEGINNEYGCAEIDFFSKLSSIPAKAFSNAYNMTDLTLRSSTLISLASTNAFTGTPIANGYGKIWVPDDLVDTYKAATNWSTYASVIDSIENYTQEHNSSITDTWDEIFAAEEDGSYATKYKIGDTKYVNYFGIPHLMRIAAFDADELADGTGNAKITWISKGTREEHRMNSTLTTAGGWAESGMRQHLIDDVLPGIDSAVRNHIKAVNKTYYFSSTDTRIAVDKIWIPSRREVGFTSNIENSGPIYSGIFTDDASRKTYIAATQIQAGYTWLRSRSSTTYFYALQPNGSNYAHEATRSLYVLFGFCT